MQSMDSVFSSSSLRWLCRETCRCMVAISVTYFMLMESHREQLCDNTIKTLNVMNHKLRRFLLCYFIMNPLVCQADNGPPETKKVTLINLTQNIKLIETPWESSPEHVFGVFSQNPGELEKHHSGLMNVTQKKTKIVSSLGRNFYNFWKYIHSQMSRGIHIAHSRTRFPSCQMLETVGIKLLHNLMGNPNSIKSVTRLHLRASHSLLARCLSILLSRAPFKGATQVWVCFCQFFHMFR